METGLYLCCFRIPVHLHILEVCDFLSSHQNLIARARVLRNQGPTKDYALVLKMRSSRDARDFYTRFHKKMFNAIEKDVFLLQKLERAQSNQKVSKESPRDKAIGKKRSKSLSKRDS